MILILCILLVLPLVSSSTCIGASTSSFTRPLIGNHTHTIVGYGYVGGCLGGDIIILPPTTGGGTSTLPFEGGLDMNYDTQFLCNETRFFLEDFGVNYTNEEFVTFKNDLTTQMGFGIEDTLLISFIEDFEKNCEKRVITKEPAVEPDPEPKRFKFFYVILLIVLILMVCCFILFYKKRKDNKSMIAILEFLGLR